MAFCEQCGTKLAPEDRFCASCGASVEAESQPQPSISPSPTSVPPTQQASSSKRESRRLIIALVVIVSLGLIGGLVAVGLYVASEANLAPYAKNAESMKGHDYVGLWYNHEKIEDTAIDENYEHHFLWTLRANGRFNFIQFTVYHDEKSYFIDDGPGNWTEDNGVLYLRYDDRTVEVPTERYDINMRTGPSGRYMKVWDANFGDTTEYEMREVMASPIPAPPAGYTKLE